MQIEKVIVDDNFVVHLDGSLESKEIHHVRDELMDIAKQAKHSMILNLNNVKFIDSSGLGLIVSLVKQTRLNGAELSVCKLSDQVLSLFEITRMTKVLTIYSSEEEALFAIN